MGSTRDFVAATLADTLIPFLRRPVEDVIYESLDQRQVPSRTDFAELRDLMNEFRSQVNGATNGVAKLVDRNEAMEDRIGTRLAALEARMTALEERFAQGGALPKPTNGTITMVRTSECEVPGCSTQPKARGLCTRHYNRWRRGTLEGFPRSA